MRRLFVFLGRLYQELWDDDVFGLAAQCAYALVFSLFPFLIALVSIAAFLPSSAGGAQLPPEMTSQMPSAVREILEARIDEVASTDRTSALTLALLIAVWSATAGASTLVTAINRAYDRLEKRGFVMRRLVGLALVAAGAVLILLPSLWGWFGGVAKEILVNFGLADVAVLVDWLRWPVILVGAFLWLTLLFRVAPEGQTKWRWISPGAIVASIGFLLANAALSFYVERATDMSVTYGALGGFVVLLLWLYAVSFVLLVGAEVNAILDQARAPLKPPPPREHAPGHLPSLGGPIRT
jgi:membrane protein